jgi:hypothetical protein
VEYLRVESMAVNDQETPSRFGLKPSGFKLGENLSGD